MHDVHDVMCARHTNDDEIIKNELLDHKSTDFEPKTAKQPITDPTKIERAREKKEEKSTAKQQ